MIQLSGVWSLVDQTGDFRCPITLPGDGITALHAAGLIPDPYWGKNEDGLRWIADRDWTATRTVTLTDSNVDLILSGLDTICSVRWNGVEVLTSRNAFRSFRIALSNVARVGDNEVSITFHNSIAAAAAEQAKQPFYVPSMHDNPNMKSMCPIPNGNMLRKVACDYGWDWNIALAPFGVVGDMRLEAANTARVDSIRVSQIHSDGQVEVDLTIKTSFADGENVSAALCGVTAEGRVSDGTAKLSLIIKNPDLWWPNGAGPQTLHDLTVTVAGTTAQRRIGLRDITLITDSDATGSRFTFRVNGTDIFAKGANWIPADALSGRITPEATRGLLQSAVDVHMNMLRIWGGGRYEADWFYDLCDELGLMIWQDFMFSCNLYPSDRAYLSEVRAEVAENAMRLHHHACIALWCGDNELVGALNWFPESRENRDRYLVNYDRLNRTIEDTLLDTIPDAVWWPSSPCPGPMDFGDSWHSDTSGDMHFWSVWHESKDFDYYRTVSPRFCSEFGFQSYPSLSAIRTFADPKDWNIASPIFEAHQKNDGGNERIAGTMFRYFRWPEKFEDFVWLSQVQQGLAIKTAVTHWRGLKPHCMGTLYWQLNDTWPVCSWSSLDYGGNWKLLHHMAQRFYAPVSVVCIPNAGGYVLKAVNDTNTPVDLTIQAKAVSMSGAIRDLASATVSVNATAINAMDIAQAAVGEDELIVFTWSGAGHSGGDHFAPRAYKTYDLPDSDLKLTVDGQTLTLTAARLSLFATVEADVPGRFSNNAFMVFPDHPATLTFTPDDPAATPKFVVRDLYSATVA